MTRNLFICFLVFVAIIPPLSAQAKKPSPSSSTVESYSLTEGAPIEISARKVELPGYVYGDETGSKDLFSPSGYMGDTGAFKQIASSYDASAPVSFGRTGKTSLKITYRARGREGWAGLYWLTPSNNWARIKGAGYDLTKAKRLTFWAKGKDGGEKISELKIGGITGPFPDSDVIVFGPIKLTKEWEQYSIPLKGKDLRHIIGGFCIIIRRSDNPNGAIFYMDEIVYRGEGEEPPLYAQGVAPPADTMRKFTVEQNESAPEIPQPTFTPVRKVILFSSGVKGFSNEMKASLEEVVSIANKEASTDILIEGHTDSMGSSQANLKLSRRRAKIVFDYLIQKGIAESRLRYEGLGEERPIETNNTKEGRKQNRRVEIVFTQAEASDEK